MWQVIKSSPLAVLAAVLVHLLLVAVLLINIDWPTEDAASGKQQEMEVIEARAVNEWEFEAREQRLREAEEKQRQAEQKRRRQAELKKQREAEAKKRREEEARRQREKAEEKKRKEAEAQRQAELKKQREAEEERRRKEEDARKQREAEEQQRQEEAARKAVEQKRREQELQAELEAEAEAQARREWLARHGDEINRYTDRIKESITRHWRIPVTASSGMRCEIVVRLLPGGEVASVRITQGSGDAVFDRSVEDAVYSAAPLPVPGVDSGLFDEFREIEFVFAPEDKR